MPSGAVTRADEAARDAVFERRSCGPGTEGPRFSGWALSAAGRTRQSLLIRRLSSRPDQLTFYLCWAPEDRPAPMTYFITIAGRRWPVALAQLRAAAIRNALADGITLPDAPGDDPGHGCRARSDDHADDADLQIPLGDAPVPARGGQPCPPRIGVIRLSGAETARLTLLARQATPG